jgi:sialate O-acetylesterase
MSSVRRRAFVILAAALAAPAIARAEVRLPALVGSHMVLQRESAARVWGWAGSGEAVRVTVGAARGEAVAGADGRWSVDLPPQPAGGPFVMTVAGRNTVALEDVWFGEVWVASGQSNMEFALAQANGGAEAAAAGCEGLRLFTVAKATSLEEKDDVTGSWAACDASTAPGFSAVAFFFGQEIHRALGVKVGLVHSSWGGTPAEAWTSRRALEAEPSLRPLVADFDLALNDADARAAFAGRLAAWEAANYHQDVANEGLEKGWAKPETDTAGWKTMELPRYWEKAGLAIDGAVWFRRAVEVPAAWAGKDLVLSLGALDDFDTTWFAGEEIGRTGNETPGYWSVPRKYAVPGRLVKPGRTVVAVRVFDHYGNGGFGGAAPELWIAPADSAAARIPLAGTWRYEVERSLPPAVPDFTTQPRYPSPDNPNSPTVLYGAMIAPLTPLSIRGAIWYQGESNAGAAHQYRTLFPTMIRDWRRAWGRGDFPFLFVQLANYMARAAEPGESSWAELREAQAMTLALPKTGMAVAIDVGEADDIHPKDKKDVGARLARWALADTYGREVEKSGPLYRSSSVEGGAIRVRFDHAAGLTTADGSPPRAFAIAGADRRWRWAEARIDGETVLVSSPQVARPAAVRYAWADDPEATLRNDAGLPASPFRTDDWPMLTAPRAALGNPVIPGFHPDPSVVRVGSDFYLVTSSFEFFPGVPIFTSRDLVHWKQLGHVLTRASQLPLEKARPSGGIYAPTLRYHDGTYYMITTNVDGGGNFFVTAKDPAGPWSEPVWLRDFAGIDPSLFFDDDGTVYLTGLSRPPGQPRGIYQTRLDPKAGKLLGPPRLVWDRTGTRYPEGPHLYKIAGRYYLTIAEGGTEYGHMVKVARSDSPWGPFEPCPRNPILTNRQTENDVPVQGTGHADLVEAPDGSWWTVFLAFRPVAGYFHHLGRETFLAPVTWDAEGWPVVNGGQPIGLEVKAAGLPAQAFPPTPTRTGFDAPLGPEWNYLRDPDASSYSLGARPGWLTLRGSATALGDAASPTWVGRRQEHLSGRVAALVDFVPGRDGEEAGISVYMNPDHRYEIAVGRASGRRQVFVRQRIGPYLEAVTASAPLDGAEPVVLQVDSTPAEYAFSYGVAVSGRPPVATKALGKAATRYLSSEVAGGFTGVYLALYATGNGRPATAPAHFDWFDDEPGKDGAGPRPQ